MLCNSSLYELCVLHVILATKTTDEKIELKLFRVLKFGKYQQQQQKLKLWIAQIKNSRERN